MQHIRAVIVPHAGYVFSGQVAASAFNQVDPKALYDNVFVLGTSHHVRFDGAAIYDKGNFLTPLGTVRVNRKLAGELEKTSPFFLTRDDAHAPEHCLEVELPFLQYRLGSKLQIVPILLGTDNPQTCRAIAEALRPYFTEKNLFVVSSDFSHYPPYAEAVKADKATEEAIVANSPDRLLRTLQENDEQHIPDFVTSLCGWPSVLTFLDLTAGRGEYAFEPVEYKNSGDSPYGAKDRVVGYWAIVVSGKTAGHQSFELKGNDKKALLRIARETVDEYVTTGAVPEVQATELSPTLRTPCGAFVTLRKRGALRGCIGRFDATDPLYRVVQQMAVASSTEDYRFAPVEPNELDEIDIEISVLTPMRRIASINEITLGKHGIYIRKGARSGTFLPQVAEETGWTKEEFLGHCAQDKAGIGWDGWKDAELYTYEALVFSETDLP